MISQIQTVVIAIGQKKQNLPVEEGNRYDLWIRSSIVSRPGVPDSAGVRG
jgi:hypothetical protein